MNFIVCVGIFFLSVIGTVSYGQTLRVVTEDYPPYNYMVNGKLSGLSTEIVEAVMQKADFHGKPKMYPWARAYAIALNKKNVLIYSIVKNKKRENLFKWVGPIISSDMIYLYKLKKRKDIQINFIEEAKKYMIGVERDDAFCLSLVEKGFISNKNLYISSNFEQSVKLLCLGRVDLIGGLELNVVYKIQKMGLNLNDFIKAYSLPEKRNYYMAFNKMTSDNIVSLFQQKLDVLKQDVAYQKIIMKYLGKE